MRRKPPRTLEQIRNAIIYGEYDFTHHAVDEMAEDRLSILDVENAILNGEITNIYLIITVYEVTEREEW